MEIWNTWRKCKEDLGNVINVKKLRNNEKRLEKFYEEWKNFKTNCTKDV